MIVDYYTSLMRIQCSFWYKWTKRRTVTYRHGWRIHCSQQWRNWRMWGNGWTWLLFRWRKWCI